MISELKKFRHGIVDLQDAIDTLHAGHLVEQDIRKGYAGDMPDLIKCLFQLQQECDKLKEMEKFYTSR